MSASHPVFLHLAGSRIAGLATSPCPDAELIDRMAADLRKYDSAADEGDAMRCLMQCGHGIGDIVALLGKARAQAGSFEAWLARVDALADLGVAGLDAAIDANNAFAEGVTAADYALNLQAARGAA